jgi:hypothetical protein
MDVGLRLSIVYHVFINPKHLWRQLIIAQLTDLNTIGLSANSDVYVTCSALEQSLLNEAIALIKSIIPSATIATLHGNLYKYPGIEKVWTLGNLTTHDPSKHLILYFHSKGMTSGDPSQVRDHCNTILTKTVILPWREVVNRFNSDSRVMKAGYVASTSGWIWFNFWWVRASYLQTVVKPIITPRRHYYEDWLARINLHPGQSQPIDESGCKFVDASDCLSLCTDNVDKRLGFGQEPDWIFRSNGWHGR